MYTIKSIEFGILSKKDVLNISVCEITNSKLNGKNVESSIYDPRLGTMDYNADCATCLMPISQCTGHFGHIKFHKHFINPLFHKYVIILLRCVCHSCGKVIFSQDYINTKINPYGELKNKDLLSEIHEKAKKIKVCNWCTFSQPDVLYQPITDEILCNGKKIEEKHILKIFKQLNDEDILSLGLNPENMRPRDMITRTFPILPPCARPFIVADENICDDDITTRYLELLRLNDHLSKETDDEQKYFSILKFKIKTFIDNSNNKSKYPKGRPIKSIKQRISGKKELIRNNIIGKRVEQSGRTVIGPGPHLKLSQIGIPRDFAAILTFPEIVNEHNIHKLEEIVNAGGAHRIEKTNGKQIEVKFALYNYGTKIMHGDVIVRNGKKILVTPYNFDQRYANNRPNQYIETLGVLRTTDFLERGNKLIPITPWSQKYVKLEIGYVVHRYIRDGDICLNNRQPTLHKGSMMGYEVVLHDQKNICFNLASTKSFNADCDGDEMNIHIPQSYLSVLELRELMMATKQIISPQTSGANICIVQDTLISSYLMTSDDEFGDAVLFNDLMIETNISFIDIEEKQFIARELGFNPYCGRVIISCFFPRDFHLKTGAIEIAAGFLIAGALTKSEINSQIIPLLAAEYPEQIVIDFIDNLQFVAVKWISEYGYSMAIDDFMPTAKKEIDDVVIDCISEAYISSRSIDNPQIREVRINACLSRAQNSGMKVAKDALKSDNNLVKSIKSGAKGDYFNIAQVCGIGGQQNIDGARIKYALNHGKRSLPYYHFEGIEDDYESRGFITSSFMHGLNPREFFHHACSGRDGIILTVCSTAGSGYNQRKLSKLLEDIKVHYDYTVRDAFDNVIQFNYGPNGFDPTKTLRNKLPFDIKRIAEKLEEDDS